MMIQAVYLPSRYPGSLIDGCSWTSSCSRRTGSVDEFPRVMAHSFTVIDGMIWTDSELWDECVSDFDLNILYEDPIS